MLLSESNCSYIVYPSWAKFSYRWEDLPGILWNPRKSGFLNPTDPYADFPLAAPRIEYIEGPVGGGILRVEVGYRERWLGALVLTQEADFKNPPGLPPGGRIDGFDADVRYIEPSESLASQFGLEKAPRLYLCLASPEHADAAGENVYWMLSYVKGIRELRGLFHLERWAESLGRSLTRLTRIPEALEAETSPWFLDETLTVAWYEVGGASERTGYEFALVLYSALALRKQSGRRLHAMHLVASIEGQPAFRRDWHNR